MVHGDPPLEIYMLEYLDRSTKSWYVYVYTAKLCGPLLARKVEGHYGAVAQLTRTQ